MANIKLSEEELVLIESIVRSPAFGILKKVISGEIEETKSLLCTVDDEKKFRQLQGRIAGLQTINNLPEFMAKRQEMMRKKKEIEEQQNRFKKKPA